MVGIRMLIILMFTSLLYACKHEANFNELKTKQSQKKLFVGMQGEIETLPVSASRFLLLNDSLYYSFINHANDKLYLANLDASNPRLTSISLKEDLIKTLNYGKVSSYDFSTDSILTLKQNLRIAVISLPTDEVTYIKNTAITDSSLMAYVDYHIPITFDDEMETIYSQVVYSEKVEKDYAYDVGFHVKLKLDEEKESEVPLKYPKAYKDGEYGHLSFMKAFFGADKIYYTSSTENYISIYDKNSNQVQQVTLFSGSHEAVSKIHKDSLWDSDKNSTNALRSFYYDDIFVDESNDLIYRVFASVMDEKTDKGFHSTLEDKTKGVVIAQDQEKIGEFNIPDRGIYYYAVSSSGFYYRMNKVVTSNDSVFQYYGLITPILD